MKHIFYIFLTLCTFQSIAQSDLTVKKIMQDPKSWVGTSPSRPIWSEDGKTLYFNWNPDTNPADSLYKLQSPWKTPVKVSQTEQRGIIFPGGDYDSKKRKKVYAKNGDIYVYDLTKKKETRLTFTASRESNPRFSADEQSVVYQWENNLFVLNTSTGLFKQLTNFTTEKDRNRRGGKKSEKDQWLENDQLALFDVLKEGKENREKSREFRAKYAVDEDPLEINMAGFGLRGMELSPDGRYVTYTLAKWANNKPTIVPDYVTESGYTEDLRARAKVGGEVSESVVGIYDIREKKDIRISTENLPGSKEAPSYYKDYDREGEGMRNVLTLMPEWSDDGKHLAITFRSTDNKDRWIGLVDPSTGEVNILDRQTDDAWIAGPGIGWTFSSGVFGWLPDNKHIYFQSEETGYSHLYILDVNSGQKKALTNGSFEIYEPRISVDKKSWYFVANKEHPGIRNVYSLPLMGGEMKQITQMGGGTSAYFSPDEKNLALIHSLSNRPNELFLQLNWKKGGEPKRITNSQTDEWKKYNWRMPEFINFEARDKAKVHARVYKPEEGKGNGAGVVFVHGAGYLQNAHQWWSSYFREYMFHNMLVDLGYTVMDIDYRGSAGYGRDWRTGIYQHMGGKDLTDQVDGAHYMADELGVDPNRIGIYGGSYGGFITLMAMFTTPGEFAAGGALRSVTDWAHYNHGYTSNILNTPVLDSIAYRKSSPIYYADGLEGALLICHGMIDTNVHFQDVVRLAQKLIELGKENWEFAVYPKESHGFVHPSSWTDEYSRILKLFETNIGNKR